MEIKQELSVAQDAAPARADEQFLKSTLGVTNREELRACRHRPLKIRALEPSVLGQSRMYDGQIHAIDTRRRLDQRKIRSRTILRCLGGAFEVSEFAGSITFLSDYVITVASA
jgi:hypothetical protein